MINHYKVPIICATHSINQLLEYNEILKTKKPYILLLFLVHHHWQCNGLCLMTNGGNFFAVFLHFCLCGFIVAWVKMRNKYTGCFLKEMNVHEWLQHRAGCYIVFQGLLDLLCVQVHTSVNTPTLKTQHFGPNFIELLSGRFWAYSILCNFHFIALLRVSTRKGVLTFTAYVHGKT